jgi:hypothetical protein
MVENVEIVRLILQNRSDAFRNSSEDFLILLGLVLTNLELVLKLLEEI